MSIKSRILLLVLLVVTASTISLGALAFRRGGEALERSIGTALANAAAETLDKVDRELQERFEDIRHWARIKSVVNAAIGEFDADWRVLSDFDEIRKTYPGIPGLFVVDDKGRVQAATDAGLMNRPLPPELAELDRRRTAATRYAGPARSDTLKSTVMLLGAPIEWAEAKLAPGSLLAALDFANVYAILEAVRVSGDSAPWFLLLDSSGRAIGMPPMLRASHGTTPPTPRELGLDLDPNALSSPRGYRVVTDPATGQRDLVGFARSRGHGTFPGLGWTLLYRVSGAEAFASIVGLKREMLRVGGALALAVTLLGFAMAFQLVRPLESLRDAMQRVQGGHFDAELTLRASGEIARLVDAFNYMLRGLRDREFLRDVFSRHVSPAVARKILSERDALKLGGERRRATILFTDIRSFTTLSEQMPAHEVVALLNEYFAEMVGIVFRFDGMVNKFIGDALMAVWGVPFDVPDASAKAAFAALEMQSRIKAISADRQARGLPAVVMGIGFTTGDVVAGNIGSPERMEYTVIGDEVNIASRIEGLTKQFGADVVMSESAYLEISEICVAEPLGPVKVKGREQPITVYRLVSMTVRPEDLRGRPS